MVNIQFSFVKRSVNSVAHIVAQTTASSAALLVWDNSVPDFLLPTLNSDNS